MNINKAKIIVLNRTNYGEADKIVTALSEDGFKLSYIAKGVRKSKSKLVAGAELFCVADICYLVGRGGMATLTSAKIIKQQAGFLNDLDRVNAAYDILKLINKRSEDSEAADYFNVLDSFLEALDNPDNNVAVIKLWVYLDILSTSGYDLQLKQQTNQLAFSEEHLYVFDYENGGFIVQNQGIFNANHIKFLRLATSNKPSNLKNINGSNEIARDLLPTIKQFLELTHN